jgi:hypothetical protein
VQKSTYKPLARPLLVNAKAHGLQAPGRRRLRRLHLQQREGDREEVGLHRAHRPPAAEGCYQYLQVLKANNT